LRITVPKLRRPSETIEIVWREIQANGQLRRVPNGASEWLWQREFGDIWGRHDLHPAISQTA